MKPVSRNTDGRLRQYLGRYGNPPEAQVDAQLELAWEQVQAKGRASQKMRTAASTNARPRTGWHIPRLALAAGAVLLALGAGAILRWPPLSPETKPAAESVDGKLYRAAAENPSAIRKGERIGLGERVRSGADNTTVLLEDGSRIEMRANSELVLEQAADGMRIRLHDGSVIITAAKQGPGHLYVQTRDVTVSVVGTVFLVNAAAAGSRVAVIEGEVHVRQGETLKKLLPGEQVATDPGMKAVAVSEEIAWSRESSLLRTLLRQSLTPSAAEAAVKFASVSMEPFDAPGSALGLACRGSDGLWNAPWGTYPIGFSGDTADGYPVDAPQGQCAGNGTLAQFIGFAYGVWMQDVLGGPDWAHARPAYGTTGSADSYAIAGAAPDPAAATTAQLRQMMQAMLADRFKLRLRLETQEQDGFALVVADGGPRLKEGSADHLRSPWFIDGGGFRGTSTLSDFALMLRRRLGPASAGSGLPPVADRTGLKGVYDYELGLSSLRLPDVLRAVEDQLGLRLQPEKVRFQTVIVDHAERPPL